MRKRAESPLAIVASSDKVGIEDLGRALHHMGWRIFGTDGTVSRLRSKGVPAENVGSLTGMPPLFGGRVKTLHQDVFAGLLYRRSDRDDEDEVSKHAIAAIDLVACTFYSMPAEPQAGGAPKNLLDRIDIGGPAMVRAAAKSHAWVLPLVDPVDYEAVVASMAADGGRPEAIGLEERRRLAVKAFRCTAAYDETVAERLAAAGTRSSRTIV